MLFFLVLLIYYIENIIEVFSSETPSLYKCLKKEIKMKELCAIEGKDTFEDDMSNIVTNNYLYIKKICGKKENCLKIEKTRFYLCFDKLVKRKIGDSCSLNEECYTGKCSLNKCLGIDFEGDCEENPNGCNPGLYCTFNDKVKKRICVEYADKNEECGYSPYLGHKVKCYKGLTCHSREDGSGKVCKKWGTFEINKEVEDERLCKSGMFFQDEIDGKQKCILVEEDSECDEESHKCNPQITGIGINPDMPTEITDDCEVINNKYICRYSSLKTQMYEKYINEYNKHYDTGKLRKLQYYKKGSFNNYKLSKLYRQYKEIDMLRANEIINENGDVNEEHECEYDFIWQFLSSSFFSYSLINFSFYFILFI